MECNCDFVSVAFFQQSFRQNMTNQNNKGRPKTTIKFESDFDFEQANTKFEEMRLNSAKLKVTEEVKPEQVLFDSSDLLFFALVCTCSAQTAWFCRSFVFLIVFHIYSSDKMLATCFILLNIGEW